MNDREKKLAWIIGVLGVIAVAFFGYRYVAAMYETRNKQIEDLQKKITFAERQQRQARSAAGRMAKYRDQSLPDTAKNEAQNKYGNWLTQQLNEAGLTKESSIGKKRGIKAGEHTLYSFNVSVKGDLRSLTNFLHKFYAADMLHRISRLKIHPIKNTKELDLDFTVDAMAVKGSTSTGDLPQGTSTRLKLADNAAYQKIILARNIFGGTNQPPKLDIPDSLTATRDAAVNFSALGSDPDSLDKLNYSIKAGGVSAKIDPATGKLQWTPSKAGEYTLTITATDDGFPPLSVNKAVLVTVNDPPPPLPEGPKKLDFDDAKYTFLSAVLESPEDNQVWLHVRTKGQTLRLKVGDKFEVGSIKGTIKSIDASYVTFESDGKMKKLEKGKNLAQSRDM